MSVNIRTELSPKVRVGLVKCLQANVDLFTIFLYEMPRIDPQVACHQLNLDVRSKYVSTKKETIP